MQLIQTIGIAVGIVTGFVLVIYLMAGWRPGMNRNDSVIDTLDTINCTLEDLLSESIAHLSDIHRTIEEMAREVRDIRNEVDRIGDKLPR